MARWFKRFALGIGGGLPACAALDLAFPEVRRRHYSGSSDARLAAAEAHLLANFWGVAPDAPPLPPEVAAGSVPVAIGEGDAAATSGRGQQTVATLVVPAASAQGRPASLPSDSGPRGDPRRGPHACELRPPGARPVPALRGAENPVVLCSGYGACLATWIRPLPTLRRRLPRRDIVAFDWLGTGRSTRPRWRWLPWQRWDLRGPGRWLPGAPTPGERCARAEEFFVDSLERWRAVMGIERMCLVGHSFGGYMAACYAMKHPDRVAHLVLVSIPGVGGPPDDGADAHAVTVERISGRLPAWARPFFRAAMRGWDAVGVTPHAMVRAAGEARGRALVDRYVDKRMGDGVDVGLRRALAAYAYHAFCGRGSAEHAISDVLTSGVWARRPLVDRLARGACCLRVPRISFLYGENDWMRARSPPEELQRRVNERRRSAGLPPSCGSDTLPGAGHQMMIQDGDAFGEALADIVDREPG
jgi:cardiolipin-specific phospholipase